MPPIKLTISKDAIDKDTIELCDGGDVSNCTHPAGHCFGSDGGSGIPVNLKVPEGQGGDFRVQKLSTDKQKLEEDSIYEKCQYCGKYNFVKKYEETKEEGTI